MSGSQTFVLSVIQILLFLTVSVNARQRNCFTNNFTGLEYLNTNSPLKEKYIFLKKHREVTKLLKINALKINRHDNLKSAPCRQACIRLTTFFTFPFRILSNEKAP